jgi:phage terminase large subunit
MSADPLHDLLPDLPPAPIDVDPFLDVLSVLDPIKTTPGHYPEDPLVFIREVLGEDLWEGQERIVRSVWANRYTSVASAHGTGKTRVLADIAITWLHLHPNSIVISTAPTGRQVEHLLWREIRAAYKRARQPLLGRPPLTTRYEIGDLWYAMGFKPQDADADPAQGFHSEHVLVIIDEAAGVPTPLIEGLSAALTTEGSRLLMTGNPTSTSGPFYDSHHSAASLYERIVIRWGDTPNARAGRTVRPYLITQLWVDEAIQKYGAGSAYVKARVDAEFVSAEDVLIPLSLIEAAAERGEDEAPVSEPVEVGLDVSRGGGDKTVLVVRAGGRILGVEEHPGGTAYAVTGWALATIAG